MSVEESIFTRTSNPRIHIYNCLVCYREVNREIDTIGGTICELEESCTHCGLYHYQFAYGNTEKMIGFVGVSYTWSVAEDHEIAKKNYLLDQSAIAETREMYRDKQVRDWFKWPMKERGLDWKASLCDRLQELNKYPLNTEALCNLVNQEVVS